MAPKKPDTLVGKLVLAPRSLWPDIAPPRGKSGWEGELRPLPSGGRAGWFVAGARYDYETNGVAEGCQGRNLYGGQCSAAGSAARPPRLPHRLYAAGLHPSQMASPMQAEWARRRITST